MGIGGCAVALPPKAFAHVRAANAHSVRKCGRPIGTDGDWVVEKSDEGSRKGLCDFEGLISKSRVLSKGPFPF